MWYNINIKQSLYLYFAFFPMVSIGEIILIEKWGGKQVEFYYIAKQNGFLKTYYSGNEASTKVSINDIASFSNTLRNAKVFKAIDEAKEVIVDKNLENCVIINQNGDIQNS